MMHRNLDRRVEALVRISSPRHLSELAGLINTGMSDATSSWHLGGDGLWERHNLAPDGHPLADLQAGLIEEYSKRRRRARRR